MYKSNPILAAKLQPSVQISKSARRPRSKSIVERPEPFELPRRSGGD